MPKILILGAGYGGVAAAEQLEKLGQPFTLINKHEYHHFTTLLHEPAGGRNDWQEYAAPLRELLRQESTEIVKAEVLAVKPNENLVVTDQGVYDYDCLVFALGNAPEYFGVPGLREHALLLRSLETAKQIREQIETMFAAYSDDPDPARLCIVVGGAGLTGIELCGELAEWLPELAARHGIPFERVQLMNIEAAPTILPMLDAELREAATEFLTAKGVRLHTGTPIVRVSQDRVELQTGEVIAAKTIIWTGGVRANPLLQEVGFTTDNKGRAKVNEYLQSVDVPNVFVIGDSAWVTGVDGKPLPPTGQAAMQMGIVAGKNASNWVNKRWLHRFAYKNLGTLASLGADVGVGNVKGIRAAGVTAGLMKEASKVKYLWGIGGLRLLTQKRGVFRRKG